MPTDEGRKLYILIAEVVRLVAAAIAGFFGGGGL